MTPVIILLGIALAISLAFNLGLIGGGAKAGWIFLIVILPFLGVLIYLIARPKMTEQDKRMIRSSRRSRGA